MKKTFPLLSIAFLIASLHSCSLADKKITDAKDYARFVSVQTSSFKGLGFIEAELKFWSNRLDKNTADLVSQSKLASLHAQHYKYTGNVYELHTADSLYKVVNYIQHHFGSGTYRALAANCVTMHRFKEANAYLDSAYMMGDDRGITQLQQIDVAIELGELHKARNILRKIIDKTSVEYLIRDAKIKDHEGKLEEGIVSMEKAYRQLQKDKQESLYSWALTNLGDMYSHANRFEDAYRSYLEALKLNAGEFHALKGIAWLAFSHDKNTTEAKKILTHLKSIHPVPDYDLMLSKIAGYENNPAAKKQYETAFLNEVTRPAYGGMYNKYIFNLYADELNNIDAAYQLALQEVNNRPTGESYNLLCWSLFKKGELEKARSLAAAHVEKICYEPDALYHLGIINAATGNKEKAKHFLQQAATSLFELGPEFKSPLQRSIAAL